MSIISRRLWRASYASRFQNPLPQEQQWVAMLQQHRLRLPQEQLLVAMLQQHRPRLSQEQLWVAMLQQHRQAQQS